MSELSLPYSRQTIGEDDIDAVVRALRADRLTQGPLVERFEHALAAYIGVEYVCVCASGTAALMLAYAAHGIGPGDEVITSSITFVATAHAAIHLGAEVRFADVDPSTGNMDVDSVARLMTPRTRAIVPVHLAGLPADLDKISTLAKQNNICVIEDACHALGASFETKNIGNTYGNTAAFSFHPVKHLTTAEGGAVATSHASMKMRMDLLRHHGIEKQAERWLSREDGPWYYEVQELGFNARLSDIQCALGISQLAKQRDWLNKRRALASFYTTQLAQVFGQQVRPQTQPSRRTSAYHLFPVLIDFPRWGTTREKVMKGLSDRGIGTQVHYIPVPMHPYYKNRYGNTSLPGATRYYDQTLSLPLFPTMETTQVEYVVSCLADLLQNSKVVPKQVSNV